MNRIRYIQLLASMERPPVAMAEALLQRDCGTQLCALARGWDKPLGEQWEKEAVPPLVVDAAAAVQRFIDGKTQVVGLAADQVRQHLAWVPCPDGLAEAVTGILSEERLRGIAEEARSRVAGRSELAWYELHLALVPFTDACQPQLEHARECWCGCWIEVGIGECPFCGDASPTQRPTRVWKRTPCMQDQLDVVPADPREGEQGRSRRPPAYERVPQGADPDKYIDEAESYDCPDGEDADESNE